MDLKQTRLTRQEWNNIEILVPENEKRILKLIVDGFNKPDIFYNTNLSLISLMKIEPNPEIHQYLYKTYFEPQIINIISKIQSKTAFEYTPLIIKKQINKKDQIRIENTNHNINNIKLHAFEFILLDLINMAITPHKINKVLSLKGYYTLIQLLKPTTTISNINPPLLQFVNKVISWCSNFITIYDIFYESPIVIENNHYILKYQDVKLFDHQKNLYNFLRNNNAKQPTLIFYTSPTGNGKTLTPLGLVSQFRVIFICASRHIGLALAKSAISMEKRIAIAFGCETADDIRLHYFSAEVYTKNHKSGGIHKVDNSFGNNIELMICDVISYTVAMHYMLSFNAEYNIITFWDEPTISMDVEEHPLHPIIHKNWCENKISKIILSCATMPKEMELLPTINDFRLKFPNAIIKTFSSFDFKKTIRILNSDGLPVLPHTLFKDYRNIIECVEYCRENQTLLRYIDLTSIIEFIRKTHININLDNINIQELNMASIKRYYLDLLLNDINPDEWTIIQHIPLWRKSTINGGSLRKINSDGAHIVKGGDLLSRTNSTPNTHYNGCVFLSTNDAYTLTDGPTLYLVEDTIKIGKFMFQQSKIPDTVLQNIISVIDNNNKLEMRIMELQKKLDDKQNASTTNTTEKKDKEGTREIREMIEFIDSIKRQIQPIQLSAQYIPNTIIHQSIWCPENTEKSFVSNVHDSFIKRVMELGNDINNEVKILLMMGIGIFCEELPIPYLEIIKELSYSQNLYLIIASSDYIYGTNYQFCHGFLGRDLENMTPQKIIQAMGRIGRANIQQNYTVRFRNDELLRRLFLPIDDGFNKEATIMNKLFSGDI
jgi:hypothetical protein